jgi:hypothetical protein
MKLSTPFADVMPPLTTAERETLRLSIESEGVRDPVDTTEDGRVLDGHNRLEIDAKAPVRKVPDSAEWSDAECKAWILGHADGRRNLSPEQKREVLKQKKATAFDLRQQDAKRFTQEVIGQMLGVAQRTVSDWFITDSGSANGNTPHLPDARVKIPAAEHRTIYDRVAAGEVQEQVAADYGVTQPRISNIVRNVTEDLALEAERASRRKKSAKDKRVIHGDFRKVGESLEDESVDLIFTDPPYDRKTLPLYGDLAALAAKKLRPGGSLVCYLGQYAIPEVIGMVTPHLRFFWPLAIIHTGQSARMNLYGIVVKWKPLLWFVRERRGDVQTFVDDLVISEQEKGAHDWQQSLVEAAYWIEALCPKNGLVFDPFCGGGTTSVAAKKLGRDYLTCDIDKDAVETALGRISDV